MITHNRRKLANLVLTRLLDQSICPSYVLIVDVGTEPFELESVLPQIEQIEVIRTNKNIGPAGGIPLAIEHITKLFGDDDHFVVLLDDDDPHENPNCIKRAVEFLQSEVGQNCSGVGFRGSIFYADSMRTLRPKNEENKDIVSVDSLHGGYCPVYRVKALENIPIWIRELFWGFEELAFGLHIRSKGGKLASFEDATILSPTKNQRVASHPDLLYRRCPTLHRYYTLRNMIKVQRRFGNVRSALSHGIMRGLVKPLLSLLINPAWSSKALAYGWLALSHGFSEKSPNLGSPSQSPTVRSLYHITRLVNRQS